MALGRPKAELRVTAVERERWSSGRVAHDGAGCGQRARIVLAVCDRRHE